MNRDIFERLVTEALEALPEYFRGKLDNVEVVVEEWREVQAEGEQVERFAVVSGLKDSPEFPQIPQPYAQPVEKPLSEDQIRDWLLPPVHERLISGRAQFLAEIRPAVALFLKFGGLDYDRDEATGEKLDAYIRLVQNIAKSGPKEKTTWQVYAKGGKGVNVFLPES